MDFAHPSDVSGKVPAGEEIAHDCLIQNRRVTIGHEARGGKRVDQLQRNDEISETKCRQQHLAEAPGKDDASTSIDSLKRRCWPSLVSVLTVVVVFEDPCI